MSLHIFTPHIRLCRKTVYNIITQKDVNFKLRIFGQLAIIFAVWVIGEIISKFLPFFIPGNVIGMLLMLVLLSLKVIKIEKIAQVANFIIENLAFFFIPALVALMVDYKIIGPSLPGSAIAIFVTAIIVFLVTGYTSEFLLYIGKKRKEKSDGRD